MRMPRRRLAAVALVLLVVVGLGYGVRAIAGAPLIVAASAPRSEGGMTLFVVSDGGVLERLRGERAEYAIYYGDRIIYPPAGKGAAFDVKDRVGTAFVPYNVFVVGNGEYDIVVRYDGSESRSRVSIHKWADYVFLRPFDKGSSIEVEVALSSATGGRPEDRILAKGQIVLSIHYHGLDGKDDRTLGALTATTRSDRTSTTVEVPRARLNAGAGYYSFEPVFHNEEARNNVQVKADPTMGNRNPPVNWIWIGP